VGHVPLGVCVFLGIGGCCLRNYELVMIVSPEVADDDVSATVDRVKAFIAEQGGDVKEVNPWGRRRLAYPIDRFREGSYVVAQLSLDPQRVRDLDNNLELADDVIRHLVVKLEDE